MGIIASVKLAGATLDDKRDGSISVVVSSVAVADVKPQTTAVATTRVTNIVGDVRVSVAAIGGTIATTPLPQVSYITMTATALLDYANRYRLVLESIALVDTMGYTIAKPLQDNSVVGDYALVAQAKLFYETVPFGDKTLIDFSSTTSDTAQGIDQLSRGTGLLKTDSVSQQDTPALFTSRPITDLFAAGDIILGKGFNKLAAETQTIVDAPAKSFTTGYYDSNGVVDASTFEFGAGVTASVTTGDFLYGFDIQQVLKDSATALDLVAVPDGATFIFNKSEADTAVISEDLSYSLTTWRTDAFTTEDNLAFGFGTTLVDNVTTDYWVRKGSGKFFTELSYADDVAEFSLDKTSVEAVTPSDTISFVAIDTFHVELLEAIDTIAIAYSISFSHAVTTEDVINVIPGKTYTDSTGTSDSMLGLGIGIGVYDDTLAHDGTVASSSTQTYALSDYFAEVYLVSYDLQLDIHKLLADTANVEDMVGVPDGGTFIINKTTTNAVTTTDNKSVSLTTGAVDSVSTSEVVGKTVARTLDDTNNTTDNSELVFGKTLTEQNGVTDSIGPFVSAKKLADIAPNTDRPFKLLARGASDSTTVSDTDAFAFGKAALETVPTQSIAIRSSSKLLNDSVNALDLITVPDGVTFIYGKSVADSAFAQTDTSVYTSKSVQDTSSISDSGTLVVAQNYVDSSYFAEDYVAAQYRNF